MSIDLLIFDGQIDKEGPVGGVTIGFTTDGFKALIETGLFNIPMVDVSGGYRGINLREHRGFVISIFSRYSPLPDPTLPEIVRALNRYAFLIHL
jgi:hypothetical protein